MRAQTLDFPFVDDLPKRSQSKLATVWDEAKGLYERQEEIGPILPVAITAQMLGVSRARVHQLLDEGLLESVRYRSTRLASFRSVKVYAEQERLRGRPVGGQRLREALEKMWDAGERTEKR